VTFGIRAKLLVSFFGVALFTAVVGAYDVATMGELNDNQRTMYVDVFGGTHLLATYVDLWSSERSTVLQYLLTDAPDTRAQLRTDIATTDAQMREIATQMDEADTDRKDVATLEDVRAKWWAYVAWRNTALNTADQGDGAAALAWYRADGARLEHDFDMTIDTFLAQKREVAAEIASGDEAAFDTTRLVAVVLAALAVGVALCSGLLAARSIAGAAHQVARAARGLAVGDLNQRVQVRSQDELGDMAAAFREMIAYQQEMARVANAIAQRDLSQEVQPKSEADVLGTAFKRMSSTLRDLVSRLEERETRVRAVLDAVADGIITVDRDDTVASLNPAAEQIFGYAGADVVGRPLSCLVRDAPDGDVGEARGYRRDGSAFPLDVARRRLELGTQVLTILTVRDATERKAAEEQAQQLARSEKLRALGQMASGIAHDLNQSLMMISSYGEMAHQSLTRSGEGRSVQEHLQTIVRAALDGGETVKRLLTFSHQKGEGRRERVNVGRLLSDIVQLTAPQWRDAAQAEGRKIDVRIVQLSGSTVVEGWPHALREALTNLLFNAFDALPNGGTVRLAARGVDDQVIVEVSDNGVGMPPEVQEHIFEPFFTTKGERGTGLGLAQVYGILQRHEGQVSVESIQGRGTTFRLVFPHAPAEAADVEVPAPAVAHSQRKLRVLAIDDEPALARIVAMMLGKVGHHVEVTTSGEEGLSRLEKEPFDLVISDLGLGSGLTGWDVAERVRQRWPHVPVVLATGWGAAIDPAEATTRGVEAVIAKPYTADHLRDLVARIAERIDSRGAAAA
jgi:PAS domain S-box-containing protein